MKLLNYIRGLRKGKEAHRLEKEAMQDPFLADAMDGYDSIGESREKQIELLRRRVTVRAARRKNNAMRWSAVACLLIGLCVGTYFLLQPESLPEDALIAFERAAPVLPVPKPSIPSVAEPTVSPAAEPAVPTAAKPSALAVAKSATPVVAEPAVSADAELSIQPDTETKPPLMAAQPIVEGLTTTENKRMGATVAAIPALREVHGKVTDKNGEPLIGATIAVKGTKLGTLSDVDGKFKLMMEGGKELVVDYIGFESMTLPADSGKNMLIAMNDDQQTLEEVVVVGYSAQKKKSITGSVSALKTMGTPQPIAGWKSFRKYLKDSLRRPTNAECAKVKGKVTLTFRINAKGRPESITIKRSFCPPADEEAIRLIKEGPDWTVGSKPVEIDINY